jgi:hypothetical protein
VNTTPELTRDRGKITIINGRGKAGHDLMADAMEDKVVTISRVQGSLTFPATFQLVGR